METLLANHTASISDLRKNPTQLIEEASGETVAILNRNKPTAYLVSPEIYEQMLDMLDDIQLTEIVKQRLNSKEKPIKVDINDL